jgi:hypothetical protein
MEARNMISDEDLLLYYYRDGLEPAERARIGSALAEQPELAQRLHKLVGKLDAVAAFPEGDVPEATRQRWSAALEAHRRVTQESFASRKPLSALLWLPAAAVVLLAITLVFQFNRQPPQQTAVITPPANTGGGSFERGLKTHLESTEQQLASLENTTPEQRERLIGTIIEQNKIYALAAERAGEPQLARVLRAFSPVLESLQAEGGDTSGSVAQLAFELRVMQGRLATGDASTTPSTTL